MTQTKTTHDQIHRFLFEHNDVRGEIVSLQQSYRQAIAHQNLSPGLKKLLGDFLCAASLLSESMKFEGGLILQARGDGDIPLIMAEATHGGDIRGIVKVRPGCAFGDDKPPLKDALGNAVLSLTIDAEQGDRYQGIVPLSEDSLADCMSHYFQQSEQRPSQLWLFSDEEQCGGLMLQALPTQKISDTDEARDIWQTLIQLSATLSAEELFTLEHETLLYRLYHEYQCRVFPAKAIRYACSCSRQRSENAIMSLGKEEALQLAREQQRLAVDCEFCGQCYLYDPEQVSQLFAKAHPLH